MGLDGLIVPGPGPRRGTQKILIKTALGVSETYCGPLLCACIYECM